MIQVAEWLTERGVRLRPRPALLLQSLLDSPHFESWTEVALVNDIAPSTARFWMRKKGLPAPTRWHQLSRALHAAQCINEASNIPLATIAKGLGFQDHTALVRLLDRAFGITTSDARRSFDPAALMNLWWERRAALVEA